MKANEIMIGDYFRIAQTGKIIKIVAVDECSGCVDYFDGDAGGGAVTMNLKDVAQHFAKYGYEQDKKDFIKKACFWLECNLSHMSSEDVKFWVEDFVQTMNA